MRYTKIINLFLLILLSIFLVGIVSASDAPDYTNTYDDKIEENNHSTNDLTYDVDNNEIKKASLIKEDKNLKNSNITNNLNDTENIETTNNTSTDYP